MARRRHQRAFSHPVHSRRSEDEGAVAHRQDMLRLLRTLPQPLLDRRASDSLPACGLSSNTETGSRPPRATGSCASAPAGVVTRTRTKKIPSRRKARMAGPPKPPPDPIGDAAQRTVRDGAAGFLNETDLELMKLRYEVPEPGSISRDFVTKSPYLARCLEISSQSPETS